jgi:protein dithiol oxidoreductase (disulfide-forming)
MNFLLKKSTLALTLSAALLLSACEKTVQSVVTPAAPVAAQTSAAQTAPAPTNFDTAGFNIVEGKDYIRLQNPQPVQTAGQSEVLEFFWYGCSHCNTVDPAVQAWKKTIPASVKFIRIHPSWGAHMEVHQKTFYTLQALNKNDAMDEKVFNALHSQQLALNTPESVSDFMAKKRHRQSRLGQRIQKLWREHRSRQSGHAVCGLWFARRSCLYCERQISSER